VSARARYFTDPALPPDPSRLRLRWLYGDQLAWELRMIVVREQRGDGWPEDRASAATIHACRAVVAARLRWPGREEALLRRLQVLAQAGELLDDSDTLELAAGQAGLPVAEIAAYCAEPEVEQALRADMAAARGRTRTAVEIIGSLADLERRPDPRSVEEVVAWAPYPLTEAEIAAVMGTG
jgi:predicted DsbA family dithiol-disulfide isomerase